MGLSPDIVSERMAVHGFPALSLPGARALNSGASDLILFPCLWFFYQYFPIPKQEGDEETRLDMVPRTGDAVLRKSPGGGLETSSTGPFRSFTSALS